MKVVINNKSHDIDPSIKQDWDLIETRKDHYHIVHNNQSINVEIVEIDTENKTISLKVNNKVHEATIKTKMDLLLEKLGMNNLSSKKVNVIKAPMPGLVLSVNVKVGDEIETGDGVLVLEAMKMENLLKSPGAGIIKSIEIKKGDAVEKNQVLIELS